MRTQLPPEIEAGRMDGEPGQMYGLFSLVCPETGRRLTVVAGDGKEWPLDPPAWEHVSVSCASGIPRWVEMQWVKSVWWLPEEVVVQIHPAESEYVNVHPNCLHLWRPVGVVIPTPPTVCV